VKKILCPTDFSDRAVEAYIFASDLALALPADLLLFHASIIPLEPSDSLLFKSPVDFPSSLQAENQKLMQMWQSLKNSDNNKNVHFHFLLEQGFPLVSIIKAAKREEADLIVMHTKADKREKIEGHFLGSVAVQVVEEVETDVLLIPGGVSFSLVKNLVYAIDIKAWDEASVKRAINLNNAFNGHLTFLYVSRQITSEQENFKVRFLEQFDGDNIDFEIKEFDNVPMGINKYLENSSADLLFMERHKKNILQKLFSESVVHTMTHHQKIPLFILHVED
jgi:nucleotide-binding universal stress UspA family protein